jgi:hypothetical protein
MRWAELTEIDTPFCGKTAYDFRALSAQSDKLLGMIADTVKGRLGPHAAPDQARMVARLALALQTEGQAREPIGARARIVK